MKERRRAEKSARAKERRDEETRRTELEEVLGFELVGVTTEEEGKESDKSVKNEERGFVEENSRKELKRTKERA